MDCDLRRINLSVQLIWIYFLAGRSLASPAGVFRGGRISSLPGEGGGGASRSPTPSNFVVYVYATDFKE